MAQETRRPTTTTTGGYKRCGTDDWIATMSRAYPNFTTQYQDGERKLGEALNKFIAQQRVDPNRTHAPIIIPIVFHVILANQAEVPDAMIMAQLTELNLSYSGLNPDSTNINYAPSFQAVRAHSEIQFALAQRTPGNLPATGIERRTIGTISTGTDFATDIIKSTANGGLDAWDPTRFFNVWIANFTDPTLLGYSSFPINSPENPTGNLNQQGVVLLPGSLPGGNAAPFNGGGTLVHESGHFFWLRHIWGDVGCGSDFPTTPGLDDTPTQSGPTAGCPSGAAAAGCGSPNPPGKMYQNYMDYTDDACYSMFTKGQVERSNQALNTFMPTLLTSDGATPPVLLLNNVGIIGTTSPPANFVTCDPTIPLTVTLRNFGSNPLTSVTITVTNNATTIQTFNWTGTLAPLTSVTVTLNPVALVAGANSIKICTSNPNGVADTDQANDCFTVNGSRGLGGALPLVEGFESTTFPPALWTVVNPDGDVTWQRTNTGFVPHGGTASAFVEHFNYPDAPNNDDLRTPPLTIGTADSVWVSFWAAYRGFPGFPFDEFELQVSTDCGQSFQVVYKARNDTAFVGPEGASSTFGAGGYAPSNIDQWKRKSIDLSSFISTGNIQLQFRAINQYGNNLFLDDINVDKKTFPNVDAGVIAVNKPMTRVCTNSEAPVVVIKNFGKVNLTSVKINYQIDGGPVATFNWTGNLARNQLATVTLAVANLGAVGNHSIRVYTSEPNNTTDQDPTNDALVKPYSVSQIITLPATVNEEFTSATFPPANWYINNPNADITWTRNGAVGKKAPGSAYFNDFANTTVDRFDDLGMPNYTYSNLDSIFLSFNLAHITKTLPGTTGARLDTLHVLLSRDCGNTFTTMYKKYGEDLQTVNDPNFQVTLNNFVPQADQWRRDSVNLGNWLNASEPLFQVAFRFSGNMENNIYVDDVTIRSQVLPAKLKNDGYLVLPNPFRSSFAIWHYQVPTTLRYVNVYNSTGQLVYSRKFPAGGQKFFLVDLSTRAAGMYTVNLGYDDSNRNVNVQVVKY